MAPDITLHFLQASRSIRIAWLLEELNLPYTLRFSPREKDKAPQAFKDATGNPLGKSPTVQDGDVTVYESGAIAEYLCEKYDEAGRLSGKASKTGSDGEDDEDDAKRRVQILQWVHEAEGTFMVHALAITYARWFCPPESIAQTEKGMANNVLLDLDFLEKQLARSGSGWLVGDAVTAADIMMHFSVQFILARGLGTKSVGDKNARWPGIRRWSAQCEGSGSYRKAVEKSGYSLFPEEGVTWKQEDKKVYEEFLAGDD